MIDKEHVAGFQSHHFREMPKFENSEKWRLTRLELVSLLKHEEPGVYISENLPNMEELDDVPTRPLNDFEAKSLSSIQNGEDVLIYEIPNTIKMFGSLRAVKQCLECHEVNRGDLLGAFSYELMRSKLIPIPKKEEEKPKA